MSASQEKPGLRFAGIAVLFTFCVVMLGAFTRLVDAGLGCPDWPVCYGHLLWPMDEQEVAAANAAFPDTPVEHDKTWPEQVHRIFASTLGLFCIALVVIAYVQRFRRGNNDYPLLLPLFLLALVILQGLFGMWTVTLKLWPQVVTAHLLGGFATLALLFLLTLRLSGKAWRASAEQFGNINRLKTLTVLVTVALVLQIALGGWTTSNYAALACPDLPQCQNSWWPTMDFAAGFNFMQDIGPNYLGGIMDSAARTAIHMSHRLGALLVTVLALLLAWRMRGVGNTQVHAWSNALLLVLLAQLALGVSNVAFALPLAIAVLHNATGALLLLVMVAINYFISTVRVESGAATGE